MTGIEPELLAYLREYDRDGDRTGARRAWCPVCREGERFTLKVTGRGVISCETGCSESAVLRALSITRSKTQSAGGVLERAAVDLFDPATREEVSCLPSAERRLERGKRIFIAAPEKAGKSISTLADAVYLILAGSKVAILDAENGPGVYGGRLVDVLNALELSDDDRLRVRDGLRYFWRPDLTLSMPPEEITEGLQPFDLVIWDSCRTWLTKLDLAEDSADEFSRFLERLVNPSWARDVSHAILDNVGHQNKTRSRGSSAKADLVDASFYIESIEPFDKRRTGRIRLVKKTARSGGLDESWVMELGGGVFGPWVTETDDDRTDERADGLLDAVVEILEDAGTWTGVDRLLRLLRDRGQKVQTKAFRAMLTAWAADPGNPVVNEAGRGYRLATPSGTGRTGADGPEPSASATALDSGPDRPVPTVGTGQDGSAPVPTSTGGPKPPGTGPAEEVAREARLIGALVGAFDATEMLPLLEDAGAPCSSREHRSTDYRSTAGGPVRCRICDPPNPGVEIIPVSYGGRS